MNFFKSEVILNPDFVASKRIIITARRYAKKDVRWSAELNSGFHSRCSVDAMKGSLKQVKEFIAKHKELES